MSRKTQSIIAVSFGLFLAVVITVSLLFADKLPHASQPEGIAGGYLFSFDVECVDESGNVLKVEKLTGKVLCGLLNRPKFKVTRPTVRVLQEKMLQIGVILHPIM